MKPASPPVLHVTRLPDQVRERIRYKHYSLRTEQAYAHDREMARFAAPARHGASGNRAFSWHVVPALAARMNDGF